MNRIIKFRIWNTRINSRGFFSFGEDIRLNDNKGVHLDGDQLKYLFENQSEYIINQFTGLLDKNNKEIFEGDVLKIPDKEMSESRIFIEYCHVWYSVFTGSWVVSYNHLYSETSDDLYEHTHKYEVVGNLFENPDLIK